jgi:predicted Zn-dependent protease
VQLARAELEVLKGRPEQAIAYYRQAIEQGETSPRVVRQLVQLLYQRQRYEEADEVIQRLQQQAPLTGEMRQLAADVALQKRDPARAVEQALNAVAADSKDYRDHLWLGQLLAASGKPRQADAEKELRRAVALADTVPETWVALVQYLAGAGRKKEAEEAIGRARSKLSAKQTPLALAQCYEAVGQVEPANEQYREALKAQPGEVLVLRSVAGFYMRTGRANEAEPLLRAIYKREVKAAPADVDWARRGLALVLAASDFQRFTEALSLVGLSLDAAGRVVETQAKDRDDSPDEQRARARVLGAQPARALRAKAVALLEDLDRRRALTGADQFLLAQLYRADGAWSRAADQLRGLVAAQDKNPVYLTLFAQCLLRQGGPGSLDEAQKCLGQLRALEKEQPPGQGALGSVELEAQILEARGQPDQAIALLRKHVERPGARPEEILMVVGQLSRQKRLADALDLCDKAWDTCPPEVAGGVSVAVLRAGQPTEAQTARVEARLRKALDGLGSKTTLLVHLADLEDLRGHFEQAEGFYRQAVQQDPRNVVALNNLAWLLAQRSGGGDEALTLINRAIELLGPRPELLDTRGVVYLSQGQADLAVKDLARATLDTPSGPRYYHLARAHQLANNRGEALRALREAERLGLSPQQLHPVERAALAKVKDELERR